MEENLDDKLKTIKDKCLVAAYNEIDSLKSTLDQKNKEIDELKGNIFRLERKCNIRGAVLNSVLSDLKLNDIKL